MPPILFIRYEPPDGEPKEFRFSSGMLTFGRDQGNDIMVPSTSVSRQHARILPAGNHWLFCDLGSTNGSWLNDEAITANRYKMLRNGDEMILADIRYTARLKAETGYPTGRYIRSLLILENEKFQREVNLESEGSQFIIGGPDSQMKIPGMMSDQVQLDIRSTASGVVITPSEGFTQATLNGDVLMDTKTLKDSDIIELSGFMIFVNDSPKTLLTDNAENMEPMAPRTPLGPPPPPKVEVPIEKRPSPGWSNEGRREPGPPRRFVFGAEGSKEPSQTDGTVSVPALQMAKARGQEPPQTGFDMNISRRMAATPPEPDESDSKLRSRRFVYGMLFIAFSLFVGLVLVLLLLLK